jgi:hypothetical protein
MPRKLLTVAGLLAIFGVVIYLMMAFLPRPLKDSDYLMAGSVATLVTLAVAFFALVRTGPNSDSIFVKKRRKGS